MANGLIKISPAAPNAAGLWVRGCLCHPSVTPGRPSTISCPLAPCHLYFEMFTKEPGNIFFSFPSGNNFCKWLTYLNSPYCRIHIYLNRHLLFIKWNIWSDCPTSSSLTIFHDLGKENRITGSCWDMVFLNWRLLWTLKLLRWRKSWNLS